jgi:hypothetical protein
MADWTRVRGLAWSLTCCVEADVGVAEGVLVVCFEDSTCRCTSSLSTRPSLPVPSISPMSSLCCLTICRTAGVASEACLPGCRCSCDGSGGRFMLSFDAGTPPATAFVSFLPSSSPCSCGTSWFGCAPEPPVSRNSSGCLPEPPLSRASSAGEISLWISMSTKGFYCQLYLLHVFIYRSYLSYPRHVIGLVVQLLDNAIEP